MSQAGVQALCVVSDKRGFFSQSKALARQLPHTCFEEPPVATKSGNTSGVTSSTVAILAGWQLRYKICLTIWPDDSLLFEGNLVLFFRLVKRQ